MVTVTVVAGVLCLYLLLGLFFTSVYVAVQNLGGAPFFANGAAAISSRALYFSFVTMTTVGYGDFTARTNLGQTLAISEALLGQIYLVTVVAAIVGRLVPRGKQAA
jgi:voltage-gated potassium channel Kch